MKWSKWWLVRHVTVTSGKWVPVPLFTLFGHPFGYWSFDVLGPFDTESEAVEYVGMDGSED